MAGRFLIFLSSRVQPDASCESGRHLSFTGPLLHKKRCTVRVHLSNLCWGSVDPAEAAGNERQYEQYQKDVKQNLGNGSGTCGYPAKSKDRCYNSNNQED